MGLYVKVSWGKKQNPKLHLLSSVRMRTESETKNHYRGPFLRSCNQTLPPQAEFLLGKSFYSDDSFGLAAEHFEVAVSEYFRADKECRVLCEGAYNYDGYNYMEYSADLFQTVTGEALMTHFLFSNQKFM